LQLPAHRQVYGFEVILGNRASARDKRASSLLDDMSSFDASKAPGTGGR
jgi:hypothetical protein